MVLQVDGGLQRNVGCNYCAAVQIYVCHNCCMHVHM